MNERIKELTKLANENISYRIDPHTFKEIDDPNGPYTRVEFNKEKFAELIIKECINRAAGCSIFVDSNKVTTSTVLFSDKETNELMRGACEAVIERGGSFSITHKFVNQLWIVEYVLDFKYNVETPEVIRSL